MNPFRKAIIYFSIFSVSGLSGLFAQTTSKIDWKEALEVYKTSLKRKHLDLIVHQNRDDLFKKIDTILKELL